MDRVRLGRILWPFLGVGPVVDVVVLFVLQNFSGAVQMDPLDQAAR